MSTTIERLTRAFHGKGWFCCSSNWASNDRDR